MKKLSALKIYKGLLDVVWWIMIVFMAMYLIINIFSLLVNDELRTPRTMGFPIRVSLSHFDLDKFQNPYSFVQEEPANVTLELKNIKSNLLSDPFILLYLISSLIGFCLSFYQLKLLRDLLSDVIDKRIFTQENVKRLRLIGMVELLTIPIGICLYLLFSILFANSSILDKSLNYSPDYWELFSSLPHALEYLIFAGIFSFGLKLKQEQDLTI